MSADIDWAAFQQQILTWYATFKRDLPWRGDADPYHVLVSEIMLQQTQVDRVIPKYQGFLRRFPTLQSLADASTADVIREWRGLGYNRRALRLKLLADVVLTRYRGRLPETADGLATLPGIGRYTSRAVACFAFGAQVAVVDTNVQHVLSTVVGRTLSLRETENLAAAILPAGRAADWNQALMDYGALVYKKERRGRPNERPEPFERTNRYWRGRIVDTLRHHAQLSFADLLLKLPEPNRDEPRIRQLVLVLREEGMVSYDVEQEVLSLPS